MIRRTFLCCCVVCFAFPTFAQEAKPLGTLELDLNRLKTWGTREYRYEASRPGSNEIVGEGRIVLKTEVADTGVVLSDRMKLTYRGKELSLELTQQCKKDNYLSPQKIESNGKGDDEVGTFVAKIEQGKATIRSNAKERQIDLPSGTVTNWAFYRLVALLPRKAGTRISFGQWMESEEMNLKKDFVAECLGAESLRFGDKEISCTKYRLTGTGIREAMFWVSEDDLLRQVVLDERKVIRLQEKEQPQK